MKILLSCLGKVAGQKGGIEKVLCNMANEMFERGHKVSIVTYENNSGRPFFFLRNEIKYYNPGFGKKDNRVIANIFNLFTTNRHKREYRRMMYSAKTASRYVKTVLDEVDPDIIITFEQKSVVVYNEFIKPKVPVVAMFHFNPEDVLANEFFHSSYSKAACIQVLMESDVNKTKRILGIDKIVWIPNTVPQYNDCANLANKVIINVGRIEHKQKRQHFIIEAMARLKDRYPDWMVQLWGDSQVDKKYFEELRELILKNKLDRHVVFCGTTSNIVEKLKQSSIFAFPSAYEGFPLALTEAMSIGLPVIGFNNAPSVKELIIDDKNGLLVEESIDAFTDGLDKLMASEKLRIRLGEKGKEEMQKYAPKIVWDKWERLLEDYRKK